MFDFIRKHTKITMGLLFLLIVPSFILFGLDGYNKNADKGSVVAKVDGQEIVQSEWDSAHLREVDRLKASMPSLDAKLLDSPEARYATLERLVRDRVLTAAAKTLKLNTSDQRLTRELQSNPEIAALRKPDGSLDMDRYRQILGSQNLSPEMFEANVRADLSSRQVLNGVAASGLALPAVANLSLNAFFEKREVQIALFPVADYIAKLNPSDVELEKFYKTIESQFQSPEQANIEYVVLDRDAIKKGITVSDADLKAYYDQNAQRFINTEERRASHILILSPKSAPEADRKIAKVKAAELLAVIKKSPDQFADFARKNSQDPGSAPTGGDLDFFARGAMVKPFSDVAFAMKKGDISDVVETEFGYHIIKLTDIKEAKQRTFEEMKSELENDVKKQQAQTKFSETIEAFTNGVYEQSDSLKPIADRLKLEVISATGISRKPLPGATGTLANAKFLNAIFSPDAIEKKRNTEAVEIASGQLASGRMTQYTAARTRPFAEVKEQVRQRWLNMRGAEEARKDGVEKLAAWKLAPDTATLKEMVIVSRDPAQTAKLSMPLINAALKANTATLPAFIGVDLGAQGYAVVKVLKVLPRDPALEANVKQEINQYTQRWTSAENMAYYNSLKARLNTEFKVAKPVQVKTDLKSATENRSTQ